MTSEPQLSGRRIQVVGVIGAGKVRSNILMQKFHYHSAVGNDLMPRPDARVLWHGD